MKLSVCSYNCCSLSKNIDIVRDLTSRQYDIIFLQETFITEDRMGELNFIDEHYNVIGCSSVYSERSLISNAGRSEGGLACLWRKDAPFKIEKVLIEKDYIASLKQSCICILMANVCINR